MLKEETESFDLEGLSVVTEQGVFGDLNIEDPSEKKVKKDKKNKDVDSE